MRLICSDCRRGLPFGTFGRCTACDGILQVVYTPEAVSGLAAIPPGPGIDRYRALLPVAAPLPYLGEADTPLIHSQRLGPALGMKALHFKNEGRNPSGAFKDRAAALAVALARQARAEGVLTASSGNAAAAIAAYCAQAGLRCLILLEPGNPPNKIRQALAAGARVLPVQTLFTRGPESLYYLLAQAASELNYYLAFVWAPVNPYLLEGIKTVSYEVAARLGRAPEAVVAPVGGGDMFAAQWRGYLELKQAGVIDRLPRMLAVQSASAPPLFEAFRARAAKVAALPSARSGLSGINVSFTGDHALGAVYESGGAVVAIKDEEALAMQARLGREEGLWLEPAAAAPAAALPQLLSQGLIDRNETVVCVCSGAGFKDARLSEAEAQEVSRRPAVGFDAGAIMEAALEAA